VSQDIKIEDISVRQDEGQGKREAAPALRQHYWLGAQA